jgi:hypothetical protein
MTVSHHMLLMLADERLASRRADATAHFRSRSLLLAGSGDEAVAAGWAGTRVGPVAKAAAAAARSAGTRVTTALVRR